MRKKPSREEYDRREQAIIDALREVNPGIYVEGVTESLFYVYINEWEEVEQNEQN